MGRPRPLWASISHGAHKASMGKHGFGRTRAFHDGKSAESHSCQAQRNDTSNAPVRLAFRRFNLLVTQGTLNSPPFHHFHAASHKPLVTLKGPSWQGGASTWRLSIASSSPALKAKSENPEQTGATGPTTLLSPQFWTGSKSRDTTEARKTISGNRSRRFHAPHFSAFALIVRGPSLGPIDAFECAGTTEPNHARLGCL